MSVVLLTIAVIGATLIWPVNRWVMRSGGRTVTYGFWVSASAAVVSGCLGLALGQLPLQPVVWAIGCMIGFAFATGYCLVAMHCLKIGPVSPTVAMVPMTAPAWPRPV